jgi:hypothetical protein
LSTASLNRFTAGISGIIPRLEPGLRWLEPRLKFLSQPQRKIKVVNFNLDWLSQTALASNQRSKSLLALTAGTVQALQKRLTKHFRTIATSLLMLISTNLLPIRPAYAAAVTPPAVVRIDSKQAPSPAATTSPSLLSRLRGFELNLFKFKKYRDLTPTQRLGTTPVFYLANSRGSSYLQADTQVRVLDLRCSCVRIVQEEEYIRCYGFQFVCSTSVMTDALALLCVSLNLV